MNTITGYSQNSYTTEKFLADPFASLYQPSEKRILQDESIENLIDYAYSLEENIPGDFDLQTVITEIKSQVLSFVRTGLLAYKIKFFKLYRKVHKNFRTFCEETLGISHWQVNRKIEAARVVIELAQAGFSILPTCEAQARPLTKLYGTELCNKWKIVVDSLKPHTITNNKINEVLGVETKTASLRLPKKLYEQIRKKAIEMELSVEQLLSIMFEEDDKISPVEEEDLAKWKEDLEILTNSQAEYIQADKENTPIGTLSENDEFDFLTKQVAQSLPKTFSKNNDSKSVNFTHKYLDQLSKQKNQMFEVKKIKSKKPLSEVLDLDKKNLLTNKKVKNIINKIDTISSNNNLFKIDQLDEDKS